jgi:hypothetical protein
VIARQKRHHRIPVLLPHIKQRRNNLRRRPPVRRLHDPRRIAARQFLRVMAFVRPRHRVNQLLPINAPLGPPPPLLDQRLLAQQRTKLLRPLVAADKPRQRPQPQPVSTRQKDAPPARGLRRYSRRFRPPACVPSECFSTRLLHSWIPAPSQADPPLPNSPFPLPPSGRLQSLPDLTSSSVPRSRRRPLCRPVRISTTLPLPITSARLAFTLGKGTNLTAVKVRCSTQCLFP